MPEKIFLKKVKQRKGPPKWKQQPRKPNAFLYAAASNLCCAYFKMLYGLRIDNSAVKDIKGPVMVISNHQCNLDFLLVAAALYPLKLNFIVSSFFFRNKTLAVLLDLMGCISKKQFVPDVGSIKSAMKVIARGDSVAIFPEGQVCIAGQNCAVDPSIGKLIKKLGVTTINVKLRGAHLTVPKWASGTMYRGGIDCVAEVLFRAADLETLTLEQITEKTIQALTYDEFAWQRDRRNAFKPVPRATKQLEHIVYSCPSCHARIGMRSDGTALVCEHCGYGVAFDAYGFFRQHGDRPLVYDNYAAWYREQQQTIKELHGAPDFSYSTACKLLRDTGDGKGYRSAGAGVTTFDKNGMRFEGCCDDKPFALSVSYDQQSGLTHTAGTWCVDIGGDDCFYGIQPEDPRETLYLIEIFNLRRSRMFQ